MPVYTLNPSHTRNGSHKASRSPSLRERMTLRRNSASSADGSETYYPTSSTSSSSTQRSRAASSGDRVAANAQARRYSAEASGVIEAPLARDPSNRLRFTVTREGTGKNARTDFVRLAEGSIGPRPVSLLPTFAPPWRPASRGSG